MKKKDVGELKRRLTKESCTFTRVTGCYVDAHKEKVVTLNETFLNLEDEEFFKYLEIAKKVLSGTIGNNLLELEFPLAEETNGGRQQFLMGIKASELKNEELLNRFYDLIIESYDYVGNFLILLFHDAYDVMTKTSDNNKLDESEEVYEYLLCAICPVVLTKPALGYREDENRIGARIRDWVVSAPENGFLFPAFTDRSSDIHSIVYYTKNARETHPELMEAGIGCESRKTNIEKRDTFHTIVRDALDTEDEEQADAILLNVQQNLNDIVEEHEIVNEKDSAPVLLTSDTIHTALEDSGIPVEIVSKIEQTCKEEFGDTPPEAEHMIDSKALTYNLQKQKEQELVQEVEELKQQLNEKDITVDPEADFDEHSVKTYDVILRVKPEKVNQIKSQIIDGQKCLVIPMNEEEHANVNGVNTQV